MEHYEAKHVGIIPARFVQTENSNRHGHRWWRLWECHTHGWTELRDGPGTGVDTIIGKPTPTRPTKMMWHIA